MFTISIIAKTGSKKNDDIKEFPGECVQYETLKEADAALGKDGNGHSKALAKLNLAIKTDALNALRQQSDPEMSAMKKRLLEATKKNPDMLKKAMEMLQAQGYEL